MFDLGACKINGRHSFLLEYLSEINTGRALVGRELLQQLDNLIEDLNNPEYFYDTAGATLRIEFIEGFCKHTKSPFSGKPFKLLLWEKAVIEAFYSFKRTGTHLRRFKKLVLLVARKNGKSTLCAALTLTEFMVGGLGIDCLCTSNDDTQAGIIFDEIASMRDMSKAIQKRTHQNLRGIFYRKAKNTIKKLTVRTGAKEGRNIHFAIVDEAHEMKDNSMVKPVEQSQSTKPEPALIIITTEGFVNGGYLDEELAKARKILRRELDDDKTLVWLFTQDCESEIWQDERSWQKSNPSLGAVKTIEYLRDQIKDAQISKADRAYMLAKDFNIKQNNAQAWLTPSEYKNPVAFTDLAKQHGLHDFMEALRGCYAIGGVDLAETTDLACARVLVMRRGDPNKYMLVQYFIPETKQDLHDDHMDYRTWARQGFVTICPGASVDFEYVTRWFLELNKRYGIRFFKCGYDGWHAKEWAKHMDDTVGVDMVMVHQDHKAMSLPMNLLEQDLKKKLVVYNAHPVDEWCLSNTAMDMNKLGQIKPAKVQGLAINRIDGTATMLDCYSVFLDFKTEYMRLVG